MSPAPGPASTRVAHRRGARARRLLTGVAAVLLATLLVASLLGVWAVRRPFPETDGLVRLAVLDRPVDVRRDGWGVPYVRASTTADLYRAQGYVHAQDRFWQMDVRRHIGAGRTAELFGAEQVEQDRFLRTMGWRRTADQEQELLASETRAVLEAYAEGVNAYLESRPQASLSVGHALLRVRNPGYDVPPWRPVDSLTWLKVMAWDLRTNYDDELSRALLSRALPRERVAELWPPYPDRHPSVVDVGPDGASTEPSAPGAPTEDEKESRAAAAAHATGLSAALAGVTGPSARGLGSNSWVLAGSRTTTGAPVLANDPHLPPGIPSVWYEIGLRCEPVGPACVDDVRGSSFAGVPGIVIGHNGRIAWGLTSLMADVTDLVVERVDPEDPDRYEVDGTFVPMDVREETIRVAGGPDVTHRVRTTRHGPVLSDVSSRVGDLDGTGAVDVPAAHVVALRWTGLEPSRTADAIPAINRARGWDDFREAARLFDLPPVGLVYADVDGHIGFQAAGRIPLRATGSGRWPVPGWTGEHWVGTVPFDELPRVADPPGGVIVAANNQVVDDEGQLLLLTTDWDYGYRAQRIVERLRAGARLSPQDQSRIQLDGTDLNARQLAPLLADLPVSGSAAVVRDVIADWDHVQHVDSPGAAAFNAWWRSLLARVFHPHLPDGERPDGDGRWYEVVRRLADDAGSWWWDDPGTRAGETRDDVLAAALADAAVELEERFGEDPDGWRWGDLHRLALREQTLGQSGSWPLERLFNRGPLRLGGGTDSVLATAWDAAQGYDVDHIPSTRMVVDLDGFQRSTSIQATGQSGHPTHPHYVDMASPWAGGETKPMHFRPEDVGAATTARLRLAPGAATSSRGP